MSGQELLFIDAAAPTAYDERSPEEGGLGGTESTVLAVAMGLAECGARVTVAQSKRAEVRESTRGLCFTPFDPKRATFESAPDAVVLVRAYKLLPRLRRAFPATRLFLWLHCDPGRHRRDLGQRARQSSARLIAVSNYHRDRLRAHLRRFDGSSSEAVPIEVVPNPLPDDLRPDATPVDPTKLLFASSPHKGLDQVLACFAHVRRSMPDLRLWIANPGYLPSEENWARGTVPLGSLRQRELVAHMRSALCLFYPQSRFAETFGLVIAEANAVGTPVLAHAIGAAPEVVANADEEIVGTDPDAVLARLERWRQGARPVVSLRPEYRRSRVLERWGQLLTERPVAPLAEGTPVAVAAEAESA